MLTAGGRRPHGKLQTGFDNRLESHLNSAIHPTTEFQEGLLTVKKWAALAKVSVPTAQRDISDLVERGVLRRNPGGSKNTSYDLTLG
ncbi:MAG: DeoR family transcriptional regulator [Caulobacteraceae bacterium]|nr:DeoR family transcriptional regulator [Caulobacteraceae bacterium]